MALSFGDCDCGEEAIVLCGPDRTPLCLTHLEKSFKTTREVVDNLSRLLEEGKVRYDDSNG